MGLFQKYNEKKELNKCIEKSNYYLDIGNYNEAKKYIKKAYNISPNNVGILNIMAIIEQNLGNFDDSLNYLNKANEIKPNDLDVLTLQFVNYIETHQLKEALNYYAKILELYPSEANNVKKLLRSEADYFYKLEKYDETLACLDKILEFDPTDSSIWEFKGRIQLFLGNLNESKLYYKKSINLNSLLSRDYVTLISLKIHVYSTNLPKNVKDEFILEIYDHALIKNPGNSFIMDLKYEILREINKNNENSDKPNLNNIDNNTGENKINISHIDKFGLTFDYPSNYLIANIPENCPDCIIALSKNNGKHDILIESSEKINYQKNIFEEKYMAYVKSLENFSNIQEFKKLNGINKSGFRATSLNSKGIVISIIYFDFNYEKTFRITLNSLLENYIEDECVKDLQIIANSLTYNNNFFIDKNPTTISNYCINCGQKLQKDAKFCHNCGSRI